MDEERLREIEGWLAYYQAHCGVTPDPSHYTQHVEELVTEGRRLRADRATLSARLRARLPAELSMEAYELWSRLEGVLEEGGRD